MGLIDVSGSSCCIITHKLRSQSYELAINQFIHRNPTSRYSNPTLSFSWIKNNCKHGCCRSHWDIISGRNLIRTNQKSLERWSLTKCDQSTRFPWKPGIRHLVSICLDSGRECQKRLCYVQYFVTVIDSLENRKIVVFSPLATRSFVRVTVEQRSYKKTLNQEKVRFEAHTYFNISFLRCWLPWVLTSIIVPVRNLIAWSAMSGWVTCVHGRSCSRVWRNQAKDIQGWGFGVLWPE